MDPSFQRIDRSKSDLYLKNSHKSIKYRLDADLLNKSMKRIAHRIGMKKSTSKGSSLETLPIHHSTSVNSALSHSKSSSHSNGKRKQFTIKLPQRRDGSQQGIDTNEQS